MNKRLNFEKHYLNLIKDVFKDKIDDYKVISGNEGKESYGNIVIEINKKWIFRFSRREIDIKQLEIEKSFLKRFSKLSPLPVPEIYFKKRA